MSPMTWVVFAAAAAVLQVLVLLPRGRGRNSGAARARDVGAVDTAHPGAHRVATRHQGSLHGGGPF